MVQKNLRPPKQKKTENNPALKALLDCCNEATIFGRHHLATNQGIVTVHICRPLWTSVGRYPYRFEINGSDLLTPLGSLDVPRCPSELNRYPADPTIQRASGLSTAGFGAA